jgi:excinuclease ABC subunit C
VIDGVPGLGPGRKQRLLREVGSVKKLRELTEDELVARTWLPDAVAKAVYARLHGLDIPDRARTPSGGATMDES